MSEPLVQNCPRPFNRGDRELGVTLFPEALSGAHRGRSGYRRGGPVHNNLDRRIGIAHNTEVTGPRVVLDTNVLVAASRSKKGASAEFLSLVGTGRFEICVSVPLLLEYESAILRGLEPNSTEWQVRIDILDYLCKVAIRRKIFFLWRPTLRDPKDEMVLETAVAGGCTSIISYNKRDFEGAERFDLTICSPHEFLNTIGALS
jgi:putative PIN family toxin of toxin-antitoxin system